MECQRLGGRRGLPGRARSEPRPQRRLHEVERTTAQRHVQSLRQGLPGRFERREHHLGGPWVARCEQHGRNATGIGRGCGRGEDFGEPLERRRSAQMSASTKAANRCSKVARSRSARSGDSRASQRCRQRNCASSRAIAATASGGASSDGWGGSKNSGHTFMLRAAESGRLPACDLARNPNNSCCRCPGARTLNNGSFGRSNASSKAAAAR